MPFTVRPDGSIITDTADEALSLQRAIMGVHTSVSSAAQAARMYGATVNGTGMVSDTPLSLKLATAKREVDYLLAKLKPFNGKTVDSTALCKALELKSVMGVGPRLRGYRSSFTDLGKSIDEVLVPEKASTGHVTWQVRVK